MNWVWYGLQGSILQFFLSSGEGIASDWEGGTRSRRGAENFELQTACDTKIN